MKALIPTMITDTKRAIKTASNIVFTIYFLPPIYSAVLSMVLIVTEIPRTLDTM